ncbi:MAG TPA: hypothetical protein VIL30_26715 [Ramlibacter sp.]|jgi:hypothetical protein
MRNDPTSVQADSATSSPASADDAMGEVAWWVSGGVSLLAWTGIALLLTGA